LKPTDRKLKQLCKELYFKWRNSDEIIRETGVKKSNLMKWIYGQRKGDHGWQVERAADGQRFIRESVEQNSRQAHGVVRLGFKMVTNSLIARDKLTDIKGNPIPLSIKEAKEVTEIITSIDKLMRLAGGEPTEIHENRNGQPDIPVKPVTITELREAILKDPFMRGLIPIKEEKKNDNGRVAIHKEDVSIIISDEELESSGIQAPMPGHGAFGDSEADPGDDSDD
jgi:hypothetical protein